MDKNRKFQEFKAKHPDWSDEQIWLAISLDMETDKTIEEKGGNIDPNDPTIFKRIIKGARDWLESVLPIIFETVKPYLDELVANIKVWIQKGIEWIIKNIPKLIKR